MTKGRKIYVSIAWALVVACMIVIFCLSAQNGDESSDLSGSFVQKLMEWLNLDIDEEIIRTCAHGLEFMGLSVLMFNAIYTTWKLKFTAFYAFVGTVCYAVTDEIHQIFVPDRAFQISDILVDSTGAIIGVAASCVILVIYLKIKERGNKNGSIKTV